MHCKTQGAPTARLTSLLRGFVLWSQRRSTAAMLIGPMLLGAGILVGTGLLVLHLHAREMSQARHELEAQALVLSNHAERAIEAIELLQTVLEERFQTPSLRTPAEFQERFAGAEVADELRGRVRTLPHLNALMIVNAGGDVINDSRLKAMPDTLVNVSDRDLYQALTAHPERTTFVGEAIRSRSTGIPTVHIARRIQSQDGVFLGIIVGSLQLDYFERLYRSVAVWEGSAISLVRTDGRLLVRYPPAERRMGQNNSRVIVPLLSGDGPVRAIVLTSPIDGRERLLAARRSTRYPVAVLASRTTASILAAWRTEAIYLASLALLLELVVIGGTLQMLRHLKDQRLLNEARAARVEAEARLVIAAARAEATRQMQTQNIRFSAALANMSQALVVLDDQNRIVLANEQLREILRVPRLELGMSSAEFIRQMVAAGTLTEAGVEAVLAEHQALQQGRVRANYKRQLADGRTLNVIFIPVEDAGWMMTLEDVTEQREAEERIAHMAHHDMLTQLPNRVLFHSRLAEAVARGGRGEMSALLCLDLDRFKSVNDTLGHPTGDALLCAVTQRLRAHVRETDTVARLGGDEFAIMQTLVQTPDDAKMLAARLIEAISMPYMIEGHKIRIGTSIGIAMIPGDGSDPDLVLKNADLALYRAKANGRGSYAFFEPDMDASMRVRRTLELHLHQALANGEFRLFYQPLMRLQDNTVSGFEALIRWAHPERGMLAPSEFVSFAEETGLIVPIGRWVLHQACQEAVRWPAPIRVSVNVSALQFGSHTLVEDVEAALQASGLEPSRLELEVTETVMLKDVEPVLRCMNQLRALGVGLALDDLGTGYSSLVYLRSFPFTKVKIDRSFIEGVGQGGNVDAVLGALIALCHALGLVVLAEGVENERQLRVLRETDCAEAQGYLFSPPLPADRVPELRERLSHHRSAPLLLTEAT